MNTLYALIIACLSLQVWFGPSALPTTSINVSEYSSTTELLAAEARSRDANKSWTTVAVPTLDDNLVEASLYLDEDGYTAAIVPATPRMQDRSIRTGVDYFADDEASDLKVSAKTELDAIQASDWW